MSWHDTHQRWQVLREIEAVLAADPSAALPWRADHAALFADPAGLRDFLRYRWTLRLQAQLDPYLTGPLEGTALDERHHALASARAGLARLTLLDEEDRLALAS